MLNEFVNEKEKNGRNLLKDVFKPNDYSIYFADYQKEEVDFIMFSKEGKIYAGDIKTYRDVNNPRPHNKFKDYQVDYKKLLAITEKAHKINGIPLLVVFFSDQLMIWNLDMVDWQSTKKDVLTNAKGGNYGQSKTLEPQAFLNLEQAYYINKNINMFS